MQLQHNHADLSTWKEIEYDLSFVMAKRVQFDESLLLLKDLIENQASGKLEATGWDIVVIKEQCKKL